MINIFYFAHIEFPLITYNKVVVRWQFGHKLVMDVGYRCFQSTRSNSSEKGGIAPGLKALR